MVRPLQEDPCRRQEHHGLLGNLGRTETLAGQYRCGQMCIRDRYDSFMVPPIYISDVYKRQACARYMKYMNYHTPEAVKFVSHQGPWYEEYRKFKESHTPVSYTHLDVYKRQPIISSLLPRII